MFNIFVNMVYIAGKNIYLFKSAMHSGTHSVWVSMATSYLWWLDVHFTLWRTADYCMWELFV